MALLSNAFRRAVWERAMRAISDQGETIPLTKVELRSTIDAIDTWLENNANGFNLSLPEAARTGLTARQKAALLTLVIQQRFEVI